MRLVFLILLTIVASAACAEVIIDLDSDLVLQYSHLYHHFYKKAFIRNMEYLQSLPPTQEYIRRMDEIKVHLAPFTLDMMRVYSEVTGYTLNEIISINYILQNYCTAVVVKKPNGGLILGRNLDYGYINTKELFIEVIYIKDGKQVIKGAGFFGFVPLLNYSYYGEYSVALNQRRNESEFEERVEKLVNGEMDPLLHLYESVMTSHNYRQLFNKLAHEKKVSAGYYILSGNKNGEAAIIARGNNKNYIQLMGSEDWFLVQANGDREDCERVVSPELNRKCSAERKLIDLGRENITAKTLYTHILSTKPNLIPSTVYISIQDHNSFEFFSIVQ